MEIRWKINNNYRRRKIVTHRPRSFSHLSSCRVKRASRRTMGRHCIGTNSLSYLWHIFFRHRYNHYVNRQEKLIVFLCSRNWLRDFARRTTRQIRIEHFVLTTKLRFQVRYTSSCVRIGKGFIFIPLSLDCGFFKYLWGIWRCKIRRLRIIYKNI